MKKAVIAMILTMYAAACYASEVEINGDCAHLHELLGDEYPAFPVQCGFQPGDRRILPSNVVNAALKRTGLSATAMDPVYIVTRAGYRLSEETVRQELTALYSEAYPDKEIRVESVKTGRDIYIAPETTHRLEADVKKTGSAQGYIRTESAKNSLSYVVKVFEEGYVLTERVRPGDDLTEKTEKMLVDVTNLRGELLKNPKGLIAARAFPKGRAVTMDMAELKPERVKGDTVLIVYNNGNIKLEISGIAEGNAVVGKSFPVRNPVSGVVLSAVYEGNGRAVVN